MSSRHIAESSSPPRSVAPKPAMFMAESATPSRGGAPTAVAASSTGSTSSSTSSGSSRTMHQLPQANAQGGSGAPAAPAVSTSGSTSSVGDARRSSFKNAALDGATAHQSSHHRLARGSCADTEGSGSAAGTITTASIPARHVTPAAAGSPSSNQAVHQQRQQQQQRGMTSSTATPPTSSRASHHSDEDVARVRAALAEAGYPNHSWGDIERVFAQLSVNHNDGAGNAAAEHRETAPTPPAAHLSRRVVPEGMAEEEHREVYYHHNHSAVTTSPTVSPLQQRQQGGCPTESSTLLHYLDPSLRLQRYIQLRERELEELCLRPSLGATRPPQRPSSAVPAAHAPGTALSHDHYDAPSASRVKASTVRGATGERAGKQQPRRRGSAVAVTHAPRVRRGGGAVGASAAAPRDPQVRVTAAHYRRAANIVFDATGDQRFRFFPTTRTPQGAGTLLTSTTALTGAAAARSAVPVSSLGSYHNYYQCPRPNPCGTVGGQVSYLDPEGRTLRRKADPVKRGEQMRLLWAKDSFLSQRGRPREAWRTRQITMAYAQDADGGAMHDG
ncbi:hypothetical protein JIQ42_08485 [Leishmania sp. Namibia]|uniref:hypothetical protein n=1 Tax=Leishmania sp. Namibia TaxID=2802991 RepID=UPI001B45FE83|nr:hypothetical protein JIQ42_08485 [Leishmania sp. Namibia]